VLVEPIVVDTAGTIFTFESGCGGEGFEHDTLFMEMRDLDDHLIAAPLDDVSFLSFEGADESVSIYGGVL
jgi:hypothetical protein